MVAPGGGEAAAQRRRAQPGARVPAVLVARSVVLAAGPLAVLLPVPAAGSSVRTVGRVECGQGRGGGLGPALGEQLAGDGDLRGPGVRGVLGGAQHAEALPVAGLGDLVGPGQRLDEARRVQHDGVRKVGVHVVGVRERLGEGAAGGGHVPVQRLQVGAGDEHGDQQRAVGGEASAEQGAQLQRGGHRGGRPLGQLADRAEESVFLVAVGEGPGAGQREPEGGLGGGGALGGEFEVGA